MTGVSWGDVFKWSHVLGADVTKDPSHWPLAVMYTEGLLSAKARTRPAWMLTSISVPTLQAETVNTVDANAVWRYGSDHHAGKCALQLCMLAVVRTQPTHKVAS
jgi:hypothetical protein